MQAPSAEPGNVEQVARVVAIRGPVVDIEVDGPLPQIHDALEIGDGEHRIVLEVQAQLNDRRVRALALQDTRGLWRGREVRMTAGPIMVPVGPAVLGRLVNVLGEIGECWRRPARRHAAQADSPPRAAAVGAVRRSSRCFRPASRCLICWPRWRKAAKPRCSGVPESERRCW